jgi:diguanylate cyclase (GGDEF)-like protein/PAS domain S-box-containing protein
MSPFDELPCPVLVTDRAGNMQTVNRQLLALVGGTQASRVGVSMEQLFPMASRVFLQTHVWPMVLREGRVREIRLQMLCEGGQQVPVFVNCEHHSADGIDRFTWVFFVSQERTRFEHELLQARQRAETASADLARRERFIRTMTDALPSLIGYWGTDLRCQFANNAYLEWFGKTPAQLLGLHMAAVLGDKLFDQNLTQVREALAGVPQEFERSVLKTDGSMGRALINYVPDRDDQGTVKGFFALTTNITRLREADAAIRLSASVFEASTDGIMVTDTDGTILSVNPAFATLTGYSADEAVGQNARILKSGRHDAAFFAAMYEQLGLTRLWKGEVWCKRKNGSIFLEELSISAIANEAGDITRYVGVSADITDQWDKAQLMRHMALHDSLTGLPNRVLLMERLSQLMAMTVREPREIALMFLDLDGFKHVNDTWGHDMGDHVLKTVAMRLQGLLRPADTVARLGGDEFVVLLDNPANRDNVGQVAQRVIREVGEPVEFNGNTGFVGTSIGVALFQSAAETPAEALLKMADDAMYLSKAAGKNTYTFAN